MEAFNEIVNFFDNVPEFEIPDDLKEYLNQYLEEFSSDERQKNLRTL